jgi:hypothetical protein
MVKQQTKGETMSTGYCSSKYAKVQVVALDGEGNWSSDWEHDSVKEAKDWVRRVGLRADYWDTRAEVHGWHKSNVVLLQIMGDGEVLCEFTPKWVEGGDR